MKTLSFVLVLILLLLGVHMLNKPIDMPYEVIGMTILGHEVHMDKEGDSTPYIVTYDVHTNSSIRYSREGYLAKYNLKSKAIRCWN